MSIKQLFKDKIQKNNNTKYKPKFSVGDIILNKKFKVIRKVIAIIDNSEHFSVNIDTGITTIKDANIIVYKLLDISNPFKETDKFKYEITKLALKIDDYYDKIDEKTAKILFGVNNEKK